MFHLLDVVLRTCPPQVVVVPVKAELPNGKRNRAVRNNLRCAHPTSAHPNAWEQLRGEQAPTRPTGDNPASEWSRRSQPRHS